MIKLPGFCNALSSPKSANIISPDGILLGDVTLFNDGRATVMNDWSGLQQWFDNPSTGHNDALWYVYTRMCDAPIFSAKIFKDADIADVKKKLAGIYAMA